MWAWHIASTLAGISLGLYFGRLMAAIILNWESSETAVKTWMAAVAFIFGGGALGSTALFEFISPAQHGAYYLGGWGVGAIFSFFQPRMPIRYTLDGVSNVIKMSDKLIDLVPDADQRAVLIAATLAPPRSIEQDAHIDEERFARTLEAATDTLAQGENREELE